jgi:hypothetical protein
MKRLIIIVLLLVLQSNIFSQESSLFPEFATSRFARSAAMGNAYTGFAEGTEAAFVNNAGLAFENDFGIIFANGQGLVYAWGDPKNISVAASLPCDFLDGNISAFVLHQKLDFMGQTDTKRIYNISYSRKLFHNFAIGGGLSWYHSTMENPGWEEFSDVSGNALTFNLSALYRIPKLNLITPMDEIRIGAVFTNLFSSTFYYIDEAQKDPICQELRVGASYSLKPELFFDDLRLFRFVLAASANYQLTKYKFDTVNPNIGIELTLLEVLSLRYGRENWKDYYDSEVTTSQFPVKRYGFGVHLPLSKILKIKQDFSLDFDMVFSKWDKEKEFQSYNSDTFDDSFLSVQAVYRM